MPKYINADEFTHRLIGICGGSDEVDTYRVFDLLQDMLADDVVEVVRCKDCKYHKSDDEMNFNYCKFHGVYINTDFCADGERRESE